MQIIQGWREREQMRECQVRKGGHSPKQQYSSLIFCTFAQSRVPRLLSHSSTGRDRSGSLVSVFRRIDRV